MEELKFLPSIYESFNNNEVYFINCTSESVIEIIEGESIQTQTAQQLINDFETNNPQLKVFCVIKNNDDFFLLFNNITKSAQDETICFALRKNSELEQVVNISLKQVGDSIEYFVF